MAPLASPSRESADYRDHNDGRSSSNYGSPTACTLSPQDFYEGILTILEATGRSNPKEYLPSCQGPKWDLILSIFRFGSTNLSFRFEFIKDRLPSSFSRLDDYLAQTDFTSMDTKEVKERETVRWFQHDCWLTAMLWFADVLSPAGSWCHTSEDSWECTVTVAKLLRPRGNNNNNSSTNSVVSPWDDGQVPIHSDARQTNRDPVVPSPWD